MPVVADVCFIAEFYHITEELFRDAIYFKEQAENLSDDPSNDPKRRRYSRASMIFSFIAIEAFINDFIIKSISNPNNPNITPSAKKLLGNTRLTIETKITLGVELITGKQVDTSNSAYMGFNRLKGWRNRLVHTDEYADIHPIYIKNSKNKKNEDIATVHNAKEGIKTVRAIIKEIHKLDGTDYPRFIDTIQ